MPERWLVVADDLTGAADCAIAFAKRGLRTIVRWGETGSAGDDETVHAFDADSRGLNADDAATRHRGVLTSLLRPGRGLVKKIDSTLRGQPAAEIAATLAVVRDRVGTAFGVLAPAFPATGRTVEDGRVRVDGARLEETELWRRDHSYPTASLPDILASRGVTARVIGLQTVRAGDDALGSALRATVADDVGIAVCDAITADDLERIAAASLAFEGAGLPADGLFWVGSAGLAHALAAACPVASLPPPTFARRAGGSLIVVGSLAAISRSAASRLARHEGVRHLRLEADVLLGASHRVRRGHILDEIVASLRAGADVLVEVGADPASDLSPDLSMAPRIVDALAGLLAPAADAAGGIVATGGETAAALLGRFGVDGLRLVDEIEPGVSLGLTLGRVEMPIITKAGAFGTNDTLTRCVERLREILRQGCVR